MQKRTYTPHIDGLRALSVLAVLFYHAFPDFILGGFIGVDVFFVISGFLISSILFNSLSENDFSLAAFYARRIRRIFPALLLVVAVGYGVGWAVLLADEYRQFGKHIAAGIGFVSNLVYWQEISYFDPTGETKPLLHLWSLGVEEQFYLVWPIFLRCIWRWHRKFWLIAAFLMIFSLGWTVFLGESGADAAFYLPFGRFWELLAGALLAWGTHFASPRLDWLRRGADGLAAAGLALLLSGIFGIERGWAYLPLWMAVPVAGAVLLLLAGEAAWVNRLLLGHRLAVGLGLISFPLYLWHWPLLSFARIVLTGTPTAGVRLGLLAVAVGLAWATWRWLERPIRQGGRGPLKVAGLAGIAGLVGGLGLLADYARVPHPYVALARGGEARLLRYDRLMADDPDYVQHTWDARQILIRAPQCHFNKEGQSFDSYAEGLPACLPFDPSRKNVLVLGDSHAADLYAALKLTQPDLHLLQATGAFCTAMRESHKENSNCRRLLDYAFAFVAKNKIDLVFVESRWPEDVAKLEADLVFLKTYAGKIILVGPPIEYTEAVPKFLSRRAAGQDLVELSRLYVNKDKFLLNQKMARLAARLGIEYMDRIAMFCDARQICALLNDAGEPLSVDYGHLVKAGAQYFGEHIAPRK